MQYPNKISKPINKDKKINTSKRGKTLEEDINTTNRYYLSTDKAVIYKKPTPISIVNVDYPKRSAAKITEAYFRLPSTTDYNGIYLGKYIDFEAKECNSKTSFPFESIHPHQIAHLRKVLNHGAIAFVIIRMSQYDEDYLIEAGKFIDYYDLNERRSLTYKWIKENGYIIPNKYTKPCDYLDALDKYLK